MSAPSDPDIVKLSVPASTEYLQLLRLNAAGVGGSILDVDEAEDVKIAIEELGAHLVRAEGEPTMSFEFSVSADGLSVTGWRTVTSGETDRPEDFVVTILEAVTDGHYCSTDDGVLRFGFHKRPSGR